MADILIDISRLFYWKLIGRMPSGIDRVGQEYVRQYADSARAVLTLGPFSAVLSREDSARAFRVVLEPAPPSKAEMARLILKAYLSWWRSPRVAGSVLFNTSHTRLDDDGYARGLRRAGARPVYIVHDLIPITHPQYFRPGQLGRHARRMRNALATGRGIIVNSRYTLEALTRFAREENRDLPPVAVAPLASGLTPPPDAPPPPLADPYFVIVSTIEPRKNHLLLLRLWRRLAGSHESQDSSYKVQGSSSKAPGAGDQLQGAGGENATIHDSRFTIHGAPAGSPVPKLVVIGQRGWECDDIVEQLDHDVALRGHVIELNSCGDRELVAYLRHARALLFPSFTEGYGLPLAEALTLGTPVIVSDLPVFREIAGDIPEYADPLDDARWMELILDYTRPDSPRRAAQIERMRGFRATTWEDHFRTVDAFLATL